MMKVEYAISGMTCQSCVSKVQETLSNVEDIKEVNVQLHYPQATIVTDNDLDLTSLNRFLANTGNYAISENEIKKELPPMPEIKPLTSLAPISIKTYQPLILIVSFIAGVSLLSQFPFSSFSAMTWMRHFMAGFFIVFSFFKLLNLKGFANSYRMYDIIAAKWNGWGYIYPFVELALGILYLTNLYPLETNITTAIILVISSIGVIESNLNKRKIKCACLGDVFNLPMSTVTIVEDLTMVVMSLLMIFL